MKKDIDCLVAMLEKKCTRFEGKERVWTFCRISGRVCSAAILGEGWDEEGAYTRHRLDKVPP